MLHSPEGSFSGTGKKVDESWKETVAKEKGQISQEAPQTPSKPSPFSVFVTSLAYQAFQTLDDQDAAQAQYLIDTLDLLHDKTKGNLTSDEQAVFDNILYELRIKFVDKSKKPG